MQKDQQILTNIKTILAQEQKLYTEPSAESRVGQTNLMSAYGIVNALGLRQFVLDNIVFKPRSQKYTINKIFNKNELIANQIYVPPEGFKTEVQILQYKNNSVPVCRLTPVNPTNNHTIIYAHGNASDMMDSVRMIQNVAVRLGMEFVVFDYTGYGCSRVSESQEEKGKEKGEEQKREISQKSIRVDFEIVLGWVTRNKKLSQIILWGFSLGTYPVCYCASKYEIPAIILQSPFASLARMFQNTSLTPQTKIKDDYLANISHIHKVNGKILLMHSSADSIIPLSHSVSLLNKYLQNRYNRNIQFLQVDRVDHNEMHLYFTTSKKNQLQDRLFEFVQKVCNEKDGESLAGKSQSRLSFSQSGNVRERSIRNEGGKIQLVTPFLGPSNQGMAWLNYISSNTTLAEINKASEDIEYLQTQNGQIKIQYSQKKKGCLCTNTTIC